MIIAKPKRRSTPFKKLSAFYLSKEDFTLFAFSSDTKRAHCIHNACGAIVRLRKQKSLEGELIVAHNHAWADSPRTKGRAMFLLYHRKQLLTIDMVCFNIQNPLALFHPDLINRYFRATAAYIDEEDLPNLYLRRVEKLTRDQHIEKTKMDDSKLENDGVYVLKFSMKSKKP
ncbi:hypothetical protein L596_022569 [Steinernema carpocapsae]|nr:hypothetical protein L596_022569 [Steinernema carpocapsae]